MCFKRKDFPMLGAPSIKVACDGLLYSGASNPEVLLVALLPSKQSSQFCLLAAPMISSIPTLANVITCSYVRSVL